MCVEEGVKTLPLNQLTASGNPRTYRNRYVGKVSEPLALYQLSASGNHSAKINADVIFIYKVDFEDYKNCLK